MPVAGREQLIRRDGGGEYPAGPLRKGRTMRFVAASMAVLFLTSVSVVKGETSPPPITEKAERPAASGFLGFNVAPIEADERADYGLKADQPGLVVLSVAPDGPAQKAGLKEGDILLALDGKTFESPETLGAFAWGTSPGKSVQAEFLHDGKSRTATIVVGTTPAQTTGGPSHEEILAHIPPEMRDQVRNLYKATEKRRKALAEKYKAEGLSEEEIEKRLKAEVREPVRIQWGR